MAEVVASFCMSLDGFVARPDDSVGPLFDWYTAGEVEVPMVGYPTTFRVSPASASYLKSFLDKVRGSAFVCGRRVFDYTRGWGGNPPGGGSAFVVTHRPPPAWSSSVLAPFTFVSDVAEAIELAAAAGDGTVGVSGPSLARQCLELGLLDEVRVDLVPVFLGSGVSYFSGLSASCGSLEQVEVVVGSGVTHLVYRVHYDGSA
ncbi:dihydrofolate reductase family protein [Amycolatopsis sp. NPDC003865]